MSRSAHTAILYAFVGLLLISPAMAQASTASTPGVRAEQASRPASRPIARAAASGEPEWLAEINRYRSAAGLPLVVDEPSWDEGILAHLHYLEDTPPEFFTGSYASAHTENPSSPFYTEAGANEAASSDLEEGGAGKTGASAIDGWWTAPFHAIGMLRSQLQRVAFAANLSSGYAGLDIIHGLEFSAPKLAPVLFPGPGATTTLTHFGGEFPDPLQSCGWNDAEGAGLPLIALLPATPPPSLRARLEGPSGEASSASGQLCIVDQNTYFSTDPVYGPTGLAILEGDQAVLLIPRHPLSTGQYTVHVEEAGEDDVSWSFTAYVPPPIDVTPPSLYGNPIVGEHLYVTAGTWSESPTEFHYTWLRCDGAGNGCGPLPSAHDTTYALVPADQGHTIRVQVSAINGGGEGSPAVSAPSPVIATAHHTTPGTQHGHAVPASLRLGRGNAEILVPRWMVGHNVTLVVKRQRRACSRAGRCSWITLARTSRTLRLLAHNMRVRLPSFRGRLVAQLRIPAQRHAGVDYTATTITRDQPS